MSTISGVQSSAAYLQAVASVTALGPAKDADGTGRTGAAAENDRMAESRMSGLSGTPQAQPSRPTDTIGNHVDTFA